ncbi:unnamed protein product, partial [marine sediment metagenome]
EDYRDIETLNFYREMTKKSLPKEKIMETIHYRLIYIPLLHKDVDMYF